MIKQGSLLIILAACLNACSYLPFNQNQHANEPAKKNADSSVNRVASTISQPFVIAAGYLRGTAGYYFTSLQSDAAAIIKVNGSVYQVGDYAGIIIPTDALFEANSDEWADGSEDVMESTALVLKRFPTQNILISGNTSGFYLARFEKELSENRAKRVAAYLWKSGINSIQEGNDTELRKLYYTGYGPFFPIASDLTASGIRMNSRIQITVYPTAADLKMDKSSWILYNVGMMDDESIMDAPGSTRSCGAKAECD